MDNFHNVMEIKEHKILQTSTLLIMQYDNVYEEKQLQYINHAIISPLNEECAFELSFSFSFFFFCGTG
jgi:hypothetical protein